MTFYMSICAVFCCQFLSIPLFAQQQKVDTTHTYFIPEVTVSDIYQTHEVRSTAPLQLFSKEALKNLHALQVSDAVKHFAGVTVKDYGGIGGLKTVSIRSLGAQHTAVGYDGIAITDCQTGQIDIGRFSLDNVDQHYITTFPHSTSGTKIHLYKANIKRNSAGNGYSGLLPNGTGVTSIIWTLLSKTMKAKQRTAITSRNTIFPPPCYTGC